MSFKNRFEGMQQQSDDFEQLENLPESSSPSDSQVMQKADATQDREYNAPVVLKQNLIEAPEEEISREDALKGYQKSILQRLDFTIDSKKSGLQEQSSNLRKLQREIMNDIDLVRDIHMRVKSKLEANIMEKESQRGKVGCVTSFTKDKILDAFAPKIDQVRQAFFEQGETFDQEIAVIQANYESVSQEIKKRIYFMDTKIDKLFSQLVSMSGDDFTDHKS